MSGDGCADICVVEPGWDCQSATCRRIVVDGGVVGPPPKYCGDGVIEGAEECDDGAANSDANYGGCSSHCLYLFCGDGIVNGDEECDLGSLHNNGTYGDPTGCTLGCTRPHYCGDGIVDSLYGEECDTVSIHCTPNCLDPIIYY